MLDQLVCNSAISLGNHLERVSVLLQYHSLAFNVNIVEAKMPAYLNFISGTYYRN
jgi:hypothetical protein